jgi:Xaa-Pro aminopeptidase
LLGIIKRKTNHRYYLHGASHYLGFDVHDRGSYGSLQAGNVITVEPGIPYSRWFPATPSGGTSGCVLVDDVLITATGYENMSAEAPWTVADIEKLMVEPSALRAGNRRILK